MYIIVSTTNVQRSAVKVTRGSGYVAQLILLFLPNESTHLGQTEAISLSLVATDRALLVLESRKRPIRDSQKKKEGEVSGEPDGGGACRPRRRGADPPPHTSQTRV